MVLDTSADWLIERVLKDRARPEQFCVALDVSGTMVLNDLESMLNAVRRALARRDYHTVCLMMFTTSVEVVAPRLHVTDRVPRWATSGGGTDIECVLKIAARPADRPDGLIVITDGYIPLSEDQQRRCASLPLGWFLTDNINADWLAFAPIQYAYDERTLLLGNGPSVNLWNDEHAEYP